MPVSQAEKTCYCLMEAKSSRMTTEISSQ